MIERIYNSRSIFYENKRKTYCYLNINALSLCLIKNNKLH